MASVDYKKQYDELIGLWHEAKAAYDQKGKRQDERAREALRILGITSGTGKRPIKAPCLKFLSEYEGLFVELPKRTITNKQNIIDDMAKKHKKTYKAIHKLIRDAIAIHNKAIKGVYHSQPTLMKKALARFKNILPPKEPPEEWKE